MTKAGIETPTPKEKITLRTANPVSEPRVKVTISQDTVTRRVSELRSEFAAGQKMLTDLDGKADELKTTMLRISGAIQVLEELLAQDNAPKEEG